MLETPGEAAAESALLSPRAQHPLRAGGAPASLLQLGEARMRPAGRRLTTATASVLGEGVHPSAIVHPSATIAPGVTIGPFCVVGPDAVLEEGVELSSHVVVSGHTTIGAGSTIFSHATVGAAPQANSTRGACRRRSAPST